MMFAKIFSFTLRNRLTSWYIGSLLLLFIVLTAVFSIFSWLTLHEQIDHHLHIVSLEAANVVANSQGQTREQALQNLVGAQGMVVLLLAEDGQPLLANSSISSLSLSTGDINQLMNNQKMDLVHPDHFTLKQIRFAIVNLVDNQKPVILVVGFSLKIVEQTFASMLLVVTVSMLILSAILSWLASSRLKRELTPLENISQTISRVKTPQDLSLRIRSAAQTRELQNIIDGVNNLLNKLELVFTSEHDFFSQAAHTLKTPLAVLRAQTEILNGSETLKKEMIITIDQATEIIDDLLLLSRIETDIRSESNPIQLTKVVVNCAELAKTLGLTKNLNIESEIEDGIRVNGDAHLLRRAIGNVIHNAINYADEGGRVRIKLKREANNRCRLTIRNTGQHINKNELPRIFDRFYRGKNATGRHGSGLGLAIAQAVIEKMNGQISLKSADKLTEVTIQLPVV